MNNELNKTTCFKSFYSVPQNETFELIIVATKASGVENASFELKNCMQKKCRYWHNLDTHNNCIINLVNENEEMTLEKVGDLFNVTRMRICQIEKNVIDKLRNIA